MSDEIVHCNKSIKHTLSTEPSMNLYAAACSSLLNFHVRCSLF